MQDTGVWTSIIIGAVGSGIAGFVIWLADLARKRIIKNYETKRVETWFY